MHFRMIKKLIFFYWSFTWHYWVITTKFTKASNQLFLFKTANRSTKEINDERFFSNVGRWGGGGVTILFTAQHRRQHNVQKPEQPDSCASTNVKNYFLTCIFCFRSNAGGGWGVADNADCLQLYTLHNHPASCIDSLFPKHPPSPSSGGRFCQMLKTLDPLWKTAEGFGGSLVLTRCSWVRRERAESGQTAVALTPAPWNERRPVGMGCHAFLLTRWNPSPSFSCSIQRFFVFTKSEMNALLPDLLLFNSTGANITPTVCKISPHFSSPDFVLSFHHCPRSPSRLAGAPCPKQRGNREGVQMKEGVTETKGEMKGSKTETWRKKKRMEKGKRVKGEVEGSRWTGSISSRLVTYSYQTNWNKLKLLLFFWHCAFLTCMVCTHKATEGVQLLSCQSQFKPWVFAGLWFCLKASK